MRGVTIAVFAVFIGFAVALAVAGRRRAFGVAPFGELLDVILADRATRMAIVLFWWWLGWHFLVARTVDL
jgi:hypothetical protein